MPTRADDAPNANGDTQTNEDELEKYPVEVLEVVLSILKAQQKAAKSSEADRASNRTEQSL